MPPLIRSARTAPPPSSGGSRYRNLTEDQIDAMLPPGDLVKHFVLRAVIQHMLSLIEVCDFFDDHIAASVTAFTPVADRYPRAVAAKAIRRAVGTWQGCPEALCRADPDTADRDG
ncbi:hypothetical protein [Gordonia sp. VNK21]|uniref:hypothetical protein n=1 Tax=Gordonia sp. VNK21 TaxID=3382483 RepID=UPI0038D493F7